MWLSVLLCTFLRKELLPSDENKHPKLEVGLKDGHFVLSKDKIMRYLV